MSSGGVVFDIQRFCLHDGPGIRTTVFLKGCPLRCAWCANPESQSSRPERAFFAERCTQCGACEQARDSLESPCYSGAQLVYGEEQTPEQVLSIVSKDRVYYDLSGGGMTLSGGEPLAQPAFSLALLERAREMGIHSLIETCGACPPEVFRPTVKAADMIFFDLKHTHPALHQARTGKSNETILQNLTWLAGTGKDLCVRITLVPTVNTDPASVSALARLLRDLGLEQRVELLPYHKLGVFKYRALGRDYPFREIGELDRKQLEGVAAQFQQHGLRVSIHP